MKKQTRFASIKSYAVVSMLVLGISSLNVNAMNHKNDHHSSGVGHSNAKGQDNHHVKMKKRFHRLAKKLDLTQEQLSKVKEIFTGMKVVKQTHKHAMSGFKEQIQSIMQRSEFDESQFETIYLEHQANFQQIAMEKAKIRHKIMQILSPEQQQKFLTIRH